MLVLTPLEQESAVHLRMLQYSPQPKQYRYVHDCVIDNFDDTNLIRPYTGAIRTSGITVGYL